MSHQEITQCNDSKILEEFKNFVDTFKTDFEGNGAIKNYADFTGISKATISRCYNDKQEIHPVHLTIMRLVNDRQKAKDEERKAKKELRNLQRTLRDRADK